MLHEILVDPEQRAVRRGEREQRRALGPGRGERLSSSTGLPAVSSSLAMDACSSGGTSTCARSNASPASADFTSPNTAAPGHSAASASAASAEGSTIAAIRVFGMLRSASACTRAI